MERALYLGTDPGNFKGEVFHYPVIEIVPRTVPEERLGDLEIFSHVILTSKNGVRVFFELLKTLKKGLPNRRYISVGRATTKALLSEGIELSKIETATVERQEGVIELLKKKGGKNVLWPHSALSRPLIKEYLVSAGTPFVDLVTYDTKAKEKLPPIELEAFDALIFTSPSTVYAFQKKFPDLCEGMRIFVQGEVTKKVVEKVFNLHAVYCITSENGEWYEKI